MTTTKRLKEVDALRGIALVMMVIYHFGFDVSFLGIADWAVQDGAWAVWRRATQFLFLGLVGVSVALSSRGFVGQLKRGAFIFAAGMLVTLVTWIFLREGFVRFGVLHLIGVAVPFVVLFKGKPFSALAVALGVLSLGAQFHEQLVESQWLFPFGLVWPGYYAVDYFPIFPWLAVPLLGLIVGEWAYPDRQPTRLKKLGEAKPLVLMGKNTLLIYLLHQPILYGFLWLVF